MHAEHDVDDDDDGDSEDSEFLREVSYFMKSVTDHKYRFEILQRKLIMMLIFYLYQIEDMS